MKPIIGVTPDFNAGNRKEWGGREPTYFLRGRYIRAIEELGGVPLVRPLRAARATRRRLLQQIDGLLLTGSGPDLPPSLYGERQRYPFEVVSERRASFELDIVNLAKQANVPLFAICGGMQTMNVACGGSLFQDIPSQISTALQHRQRNPAIHLSHTVTVTPGSLLRRIVRSKSMRVNSSHHQSVNAVAPSLIASALAPDGIVEANGYPTPPFLLFFHSHSVLFFSSV